MHVYTQEDSKEIYFIFCYIFYEFTQNLEADMNFRDYLND
jgi:hypothetical protein